MRLKQATTDDTDNANNTDNGEICANRETFHA